MEAAPHLRLALTSDPANVSLVRDVVTGVALTIALEEPDLDDILTALSEAVNNVVLHAYPDGRGPFWVALWIHGERIEATVRDRGRGMAVPAPDPDDLMPYGVGLAAIRAFSAAMDVVGPADGGTEIRMRFDVVCGAPPPTQTSCSEPAFQPLLAGDSRLELRPASLAGSVFGRMVVSLAARAHFTLDRLSDAELVATALAASAGQRLGWATFDAVLTWDRRTVELRIEPPHGSDARHLLSRSASDVNGPLLARLSDQVEVIDDGGRERLTVRLYDRRP